MKPRRPDRASVPGTLRPILWVLLAIVGGLLLIVGGVLIASILPDRELREPVHRFVIENRTEGPISRLELTNRGPYGTSAPLLLDAIDDVPAGGRWIVERGLDAAMRVGLNVDEAGVRYEFHRVGHTDTDLGTVQILTIWPGPRVNRWDADVTREP